METPIKQRAESVHEVSIQTVVSISVATNIPGFETQHFCRASMSPSDGTLLITEFMDHLHVLAVELQELIPSEIRALTEKLEVELKETAFCKSKTKMMKLLNYLKSFRTLNVFGFNSGKSKWDCQNNFDHFHNVAELPLKMIRKRQNNT